MPIGLLADSELHSKQWAHKVHLARPAGNGETSAVMAGEHVYLQDDSEEKDAEIGLFRAQTVPRSSSRRHVIESYPSSRSHRQVMGPRNPVDTSGKKTTRLHSKMELGATKSILLGLQMSAPGRD